MQYKKESNKMNKSRLFLLTSLIFLLASTMPATSYSADIVPKDLRNQPLFGTVIQEGQTFQNISYVMASSTPQDGGLSYNKNCASFSDPRCVDAPIIRGNIVMPVCKNAEDQFCIAALEFINSNGSKEQAKLVFEATTQTIPASSTFNTGAGGGISVWNAPGARHNGSTGDYIVKVAIAAESVKGKIQPRILGLEASVTPVVMTNEPGAKQARACEKPDPNLGGALNTSYGWACSDNQPDPATYDRCSQMMDGLCFMRQDFANGVSVALSLRVNNQITGWLFGRMSDPKVSVSAIDKSSNLLRVEGRAESVPTLVGYVEKKNLSQTPEIRKIFEERCSAPGNYMTCERMLVSNFFDGSLGSGLNRFSDYELFSKQIKAYSGTDINFKNDTHWSFGSTSYQGRKDAESACFADTSQLLGLVTTNAPIYESGPPKLVDSFLTYKVAGAHYNADGSLFKGTYDFALRSSVARCLYGFTKAPISATVSISSGDGTVNNIATEIVREQNGWMTLSARGFTFSAPVIRIKLSQEKTATAPTPAAATKTASKLLTIACIKGKTTKKVTALKPTCPKGFNKK